MKSILILFIAGTFLFGILFFILKKRKEAKKITHNLNKIQEPGRLKKTLKKIWDENLNLINIDEIPNAKIWFDNTIIKIDKRELKTLAEILKSLNEQNFSNRLK